MQAVILAGGLGTRLWPETRQTPKPMVRVAGVPYLEHQLRLLASQSILDVILLTGYLGEQIEDYFGDGARCGLQIRYSREPRPLGTGGALRLAGPLLSDPFLLIYGDSYLPVQYAELVDVLAGNHVTGVMTVYHDATAETKVYGNVALDSSGFVSRYDKSNMDDPSLRYVEAGVLAFRRYVIDWIPVRDPARDPGGPVSLEREVFPLLIAQRQLFGAPTLQRFYDIGTPERLKAFQDVLS